MVLQKKKNAQAYKVVKIVEIYDNKYNEIPLNTYTSKDLVKLSLCWLCDENIVKKYPTIQKSIKKNAKYYFGSWAEQRKEKRDD